MLRLRDRSGGGRWQYLVPYTGHTITGTSFNQLMMNIRKHLNANDLDHITIEEGIVEDYNAQIFSKVNPGCCYDTAIVPLNERRLSWMDVVRFTKTMVKNIAGGSQRVTQEEADRRAAICAGCPLNQATNNCKSCSNSGLAAATIGLLVGDKQTSSHEHLYSCLHCGCFIKAMVWFPKEDLQHTPPDGFEKTPPQNCWKL